VIGPVIRPQGSFVELAGHGQERFPYQEEEKPGGQQAQRKLTRARQSHKPAALGQAGRNHPAQATGADQAVRMFGDTLTAVEPAALQTLGRRFTLRMIETPLLEEMGHEL
jgi:hypothetical protein